MEEAESRKHFSELFYVIILVPILCKKRVRKKQNNLQLFLRNHHRHGEFHKKIGVAFWSPFPYSLIPYAATPQEFGLTPFVTLPYPGAQFLQESSHPVIPLQFQRFAFSMYCRRGSPTITRRPKFYPLARESKVRSFLRNFALFVFSFYLYIPLTKWSFPCLILTDNPRSVSLIS